MKERYLSISSPTPERRFNRAYGVEAGTRALLNPRVWPAIARAVTVALSDVILRRRPMPPLFPDVGRYGSVLAVHYGEHADDQWSVDHVLLLAIRQDVKMLPSETMQSAG